MRPPCEQVVRYVLPAIRSIVAKDLIKNHGFTQVAAAKKLGTTQAAISHYLYSKRGEKWINELRRNKAVMATVNDVTSGITEEKYESVHVVSKLCELCEALRSEDGSSVLCDGSSTPRATSSSFRPKMEPSSSS
jgi:predicted transcriptional regulator